MCFSKNKVYIKCSENMYAISLFNPRKAALANMKDFFYTAYEGRELLEKKLAKEYWR